jgi:hypothetical protein
MGISTGTRSKNAPRGIRFGVIRTLIAAFGICSIAWAVFSIDANRGQAPLGGAVDAILKGEAFDSETLSQFGRQLGSEPADRLRPAALYDLAVIRLRLLEIELNNGPPQAESPDFAELEAALAAALSKDPSNSFLWFVDYWLSRVRPDETGHRIASLRMSYAMGPNEAWIAQRRNPVALENFSTLPPDMAEQAVSEFVRLVKSRLYADATNILTGSGWPLHEKLLSRLASLDEVDRHAMSRELSKKEIDGASVPGIPNERSSRPF